MANALKYATSYGRALEQMAQAGMYLTMLNTWICQILLFVLLIPYITA